MKSESQKIADEKTGSSPNGLKTAELLKKKGIQSPPLRRMVEIRRGTWMQLPEEIEGEKQIEAWKKIKLNELQTVDYAKW